MIKQKKEILKSDIIVKELSENVAVVKTVQEQIQELKKWLLDHDYLVNKVFLGELDRNSQEFQEYLSERNNVIAKINALEQVRKV